MRTIPRTLAPVLLALTATVMLGGAAHAAPFTIGNLTPGSVFFVQGQSFTPSLQGNAGAGVAPVSGTVYLDTFTIQYETPGTGFASLYIYAALPSLADAALGTGSLAAGTYLGGGLYDFANTPLDAATKYFAVLPGPAAIFDGDGDLYAGGIDLFDRSPEDGQLDEGFGPFDTGFSASFSSAVPTPGTAVLVLAAMAGLALTRRRRVQA